MKNPVTLLFDLDNTLLGNDIDQFLPAYMQALAQRMSDYADPAKLISALLSAVRQMVRYPKADCTLEQLFDAVFYPSLGLEKQAVRATIDAFYAEDFPKLKKLTQIRAEASPVVRLAMERGYPIGVATNPLFPLTAIRQRLDWAGLSPIGIPFALVPSFETFHFSKPHPEYYAEFLARLGWPEGAVVMVGDDLKNDILPARKLGLPVFWVKPDGAVLPEGIEAPNASGTLAAFFPWLDSLALETLQPTFDTPAAMAAILRTTAAAITSMLASLPSEAWIRQPAAHEWSLAEILCHLRDVEAEVNLPRLEKVLQEANPFLPGKDTDPWAEERHYITQDGPRALAEFTFSRLKLLALLDTLNPEDWERPARHAIFGPTRLRELVGIIASHDRLHVRQVAGTKRLVALN